jgi:integrase/recombinase XerD
VLRINEQLGANVTLHDFRHTCGARLASDPSVSLVDVQAHLRHRHLSTTEIYLAARPEDVIRRVQAHHQASPIAASSNAPCWTYQAEDLATLLGKHTP